MKRRLSITLIITLLFLLGSGSYAFAKKVDIHLDVDKTILTLKDSLTVTVTIKTKGIKSTPYPKLPKIPIMESYRTSHGQNVSFVNGKVSMEKTTSIVYVPHKTGKAKVGPAKVKVGGKMYKSNTMEVRVVDSNTIAAAPKVDGPDEKTQRDDVFLKVVTKPEKPTLGEQVTVSLYLYTNTRLSGLNFTKYPDFKDFWSEDLVTPRSPDFTETKVRGKAYNVALIRRYALFPLKTGKVTIEPFGMEGRIISSDRRPRNDWSIFIPSAGKPVSLQSPQKVINVLPLPKENRPGGFKDIVGSFDLKIRMDKKEVKVGAPITLYMIVSGTGNFKTLSSPSVNIPAGINTYSETNELEIKSDIDKVGGVKTFSMILVPRNEGEHEIGPVVLDFFDPKSKAYRRLSKGPFKIMVGKADNSDDQGSLIVNQKEVTLSGSDIRYIRADAKSLNEIKDPYYSHPLFLVLILIWPPGLLVVFAYTRFRKASLADKNKLRYRRAGRVARTRLKKAKGFIKTDSDEFYGEVTGALLGFITDRTKGYESGIVVNHLIRDLKNCGADPKAIADLAQLFSKADSVRYGGASSDPADRKEALKKAKSLIGKLDKKDILLKLSKS